MKNIRQATLAVLSVLTVTFLTACGGGDGGAGGTVGATDTTRPTITAFTMPATAASLTVSVSSFTAADNVLVTGYMITQSAALPDAGAAGWTATAPATVTVTAAAAAAGSQTFFAWAKDAAGNVSLTATSQTVTITVDTTAPAVTAFTMPPSATSLSVSISTFTATDIVGVTGYLVTQSDIPPAATAVGWTATAPTAVTADAAGSKTFFPWAKDAAGNVSTVFGTPANVIITLATPAVSVAVAASGTDTTSAAGADATFTFAAVDGAIIVFNISGFGAGDKLVFPVFGGAPNALSLVNTSPADGIVTVNLTRNVGGQKFDITAVLNGLTAAQDQQIVDGDVGSLNVVFGAGSIR